MALDYNRLALCEEIVKYSHQLDQKGFTANHDGNITCKYQNLLLATPTAVSKGDMRVEMVIALDMQGNKVDGIGKPFSEIKLHLAAYTTRGETKAVIHAHPPFATARGLLNSPVICSLPEAIVSIGECVPVAPYAMPGTPESEAGVAEILTKYDACLIAGNGVLAIGDTIEQAYLRLELVEHLAKIDYYAKTMGRPMELPTQDVAKLLEKRAAAGFGPTSVPASPNLASQQLRDLIACELKELLK